MRQRLGGCDGLRVYSELALDRPLAEHHPDRATGLCCSRQGTADVRFRNRSAHYALRDSSPQSAEARADLADECLRLLEGRKVSASFKLVEVDELGKAFFSPAP